MPKITKRFVEELTPPAEKFLTFWDSDLKGFGIVITPKGRRTYCIQYRNAERVLKRLKIGVHGQLATEQARVLAKKTLASVTQGADPVAKRREVARLPTLEQLVSDYFLHHGPHKKVKSLSYDAFLIKLILTEWPHKKVSHLMRKDIEALHLKLGNTPYNANRMLSVLSKMYSFAISWGWVAANPVKGIKRYAEEKRDRWLNEEESVRFWTTLDQYPEHLTAYLFKLLLLTGARKGELQNATWDQFNLEKGVWTKPAHTTKQKKLHHLPLSAKALYVLQQIRERVAPHCPYLFPGKKEGKPIQEIKTFWKTVLKKAGIENFRVHDIRHTHAAHLASKGVSLKIVGDLLGHTQASTTQRYAHLADASLREATDLFSDQLDGMLKKKQAVVEM